MVRYWYRQHRAPLSDGPSSRTISVWVKRHEYVRDGSPEPYQRKQPRVERVVRVSSAVFVRRVATVANGHAPCDEWYASRRCLRVSLWAILRLLVACAIVATGHAQSEERWPGRGGPHVLLWAILRLLVAWTTVATGHVQGEERWPGWGDPRVLSWDEWVA